MNTSTVPKAWIERLPKVDLHCHLIGTVRASTFAELARRERLPLPDAPERIYADINSLPPDPTLYRNTVVPVPQGRSQDEPAVSYSMTNALMPRCLKYSLALRLQPQVVSE